VNACEMRRDRPSSCIEDLFEKYRPLIYSICSSIWGKQAYRITSYDDLFQTACYIFVYAYHTWIPERGKFGSHLKRVLKYKLMNMLKGSAPPWSRGYPFTFLSDFKSISFDERVETTAHKLAEDPTFYNAVLDILEQQ